MVEKKNKDGKLAQLTTQSNIGSTTHCKNNANIMYKKKLLEFKIDIHAQVNI